MRSYYTTVLVALALIHVGQQQNTNAESVKERSLDDVRAHMSDLGQRLDRMRQSMRDRLKQIADKTSSIAGRSLYHIPIGTKHDFYGPYQEIKFPYRTSFMIGNGSARSRRPKELTEDGWRVIPASYEPLDLSKTMPEGMCSNMTLLDSVNVRVCGEAKGCTTLTSPEHYMKSCPSSYSSWCTNCYTG